jgi:hypothetical protein
MYYTEKINHLIDDYNRIQQEEIKNVKENNKGLSEELLDRIFDQIINNNKEIFKSYANHLLSELNSELVGVEYQLIHIRTAIVKTKIFLNLIPGDKELYIEVPDSSNISDLQLLSYLMKKNSTGVYNDSSEQKD